MKNQHNEQSEQRQDSQGQREHVAGKCAAVRTLLPFTAHSEQHGSREGYGIREGERNGRGISTSDHMAILQKSDVPSRSFLVLTQSLKMIYLVDG